MASYADTQTKLVVNRVPYFKTGTIVDGATATIAFDNLNNSTRPMEAQVKQLVLKAVGADMTYQILAVLNRSQASTYPDLTTANGFEGV